MRNVVNTLIRECKYWVASRQINAYITELSEQFVLRTLQNNGYTEQDVQETVQGIINVLGFKCYVLRGKQFQCVGEDSEKCANWFKILVVSIPRGRFEKECEHVRKKIVETRKTTNPRGIPWTN